MKNIKTTKLLLMLLFPLSEKKKYTLKYPIVSKDGAFSQAITRGAYPTNVIIKRAGTIQEYISGGMVGIGKQIEAAIEAALN
jgi:hypothetical protein